LLLKKKDNAEKGNKDALVQKREKKALYGERA